MEGFIIILCLVGSILSIALFVKLWIMTNNIKQITQLLLSEAEKREKQSRIDAHSPSEKQGDDQTTCSAHKQNGSDDQGEEQGKEGASTLFVFGIVFIILFVAFLIFIAAAQ